MFLQLCEEMGLQHVSEGVALERYVTVSKTVFSRCQSTEDTSKCEPNDDWEAVTKQGPEVATEQLSTGDNEDVFSKEMISGMFM